MKQETKTTEVFIMQKDDEMSPWFTLQSAVSRKHASEMIFRFEMRRAIAKKVWPRWKVQ